MVNTTPTRLIVVLRTELGFQLRLAHKRFAEAQESYTTFDPRRQREIERAEGSIKRIDTAQQALGALMLGDIEDDYELPAELCHYQASVPNSRPCKRKAVKDGYCDKHQ